MHLPFDWAKHHRPCARPQPRPPEPEAWQDRIAVDGILPPVIGGGSLTHDPLSMGANEAPIPLELSKSHEACSAANRYNAYNRNTLG